MGDEPVLNDLQHVQQLVRQVNIPQEKVVKVYHHGRERADGKPQITKVEFADYDSRRRFLSGLRPTLMAGKPPGTRVPFFARPDLTHEELLRQKELNAERIRKNQAGGDFVIFRGAVVERVERDKLRSTAGPFSQN
ncbi:MAG: hypothetical protein GY820_33335 [Gammaproteobacteria bacterium]|nr:hypothetical protein [Gammaproteobacteria bacterium]